MGDFRIVEHTADVGIRAWGASLEETFEAATRGLATILGGWRPAPGEVHRVTIEPGDLGAQLVDWLSEVIYLQESLDSVVAGVDVERVSEEGTSGSVTVVPRAGEVLEGTAVKAITYHQLRVERTAEGWMAQVYVDV